jgi:hypothetical protein
VLTTIAQPVVNMPFLDNLEESLFPEEAGNGEIIQDELPIELEERLSIEQIEKYNERLKYMEDNGI